MGRDFEVEFRGEGEGEVGERQLVDGGTPEGEQVEVNA